MLLRTRLSCSSLVRLARGCNAEPVHVNGCESITISRMFPDASQSTSWPPQICSAPASGTLAWDSRAQMPLQPPFGLQQLRATPWRPCMIGKLLSHKFIGFSLQPDHNLPDASRAVTHSTYRSGLFPCFSRLPQENFR